MRHAVLCWCVLAAFAVGQDADRRIEKAFELLMKSAAPPKDADDAKKKAAADDFRASLAAFTAEWAPRASELGPGRRHLARALLLSGRPAEAVPHLEDFVKRQSASPDVEEALMDLGAAYLDVRETEKARALYETFLAERPKSDLATAARFYLGVAHLDAGRLDEGLAALEAVAGSGADHPLVADARLKIVRALAEAGRVDAAREKLKAALAESSDAAALAALKEELDRYGAAPPEIENVRTWLGGPAVKLADEKGRVVVVCFFADLYASNQAELALLNDLAKKTAGRPVTVVALTTYYRRKQMSMDEEDARLRRMLADQGLIFRVGVVSDFSLLKAYGVRGVPHTVVVGKDGKVAHLKVGGSRFERRSADALVAAVEREAADAASRPAK